MKQVLFTTGFQKVLDKHLSGKHNKFSDIPVSALIGYNAPGSSVENAISVVAAENIAAFSPVIAGGYIADSTNLLHRLKVVGIAREPIGNGFAGPVQVNGPLFNPLWSWSTGQPVYINGKQLSAVCPGDDLSRWCQQIGMAVSPDTIIIDLKFSILL